MDEQRRDLSAIRNHRLSSELDSSLEGFWQCFFSDRQEFIDIEVELRSCYLKANFTVLEGQHQAKQFIPPISHSQSLKSCLHPPAHM
jgi:hypothetical protein